MNAPTAGQLLNNALQGASRVTRPTPIERAIADIDASAERWFASLHQRGGSDLVREPHRIPRAVYGISAALEWPCAKSTVEVLADCREFIRCQQQHGRENSQHYDMGRLTELRQAETALIRMLGGN